MRNYIEVGGVVDVKFEIDELINKLCDDLTKEELEDLVLAIDECVCDYDFTESVANKFAERLAIDKAMEEG